MNVQEIKDYVIRKIGIEIPDGYVIDYINETMDSLTIEYDSAGKKKTTYLYGIDGEWTDLPNDCIAVKRCFKDSFPYDDFITENGQIKFDIPGEYKVEMIITQPHVTALTDTPNMNMVYHEAIALGVSYKEANRVFMYDNETIKIQIFQEYAQAKSKANEKLSMQKRSRKRMKFAPFM